MLFQTGDGQIRIGNVTGIGPKLTINPGNYLLKKDQYGEFYLVRTQDFKLPSKIYGDTSIIERWTKSYEFNSNKNMGILLSGLKGAGKTILAQKLCIDSKKPVILITEPFFGPNFIQFISDPVFEDCIVFIDEFEKIYPENEMTTDLLSLFDGNMTTRLIFLVTVNDVSRVSDFMINRPSRLKYRKHYSNLEMEVVDEVIEDLLVNKEHKKGLIQELIKIGMITYDIVITLIKDMNLFQEDAKTVVKYLNLKREASNFKVKEIFKGEQYDCNDIYCNPFETNPNTSYSFYRKRVPEIGRIVRINCLKLYKHQSIDLLELEQESELIEKCSQEGISENDFHYAKDSRNYISFTPASTEDGETCEVIVLSDGTIQVNIQDYDESITFILTPMYNSKLMF